MQEADEPEEGRRLPLPPAVLPAGAQEPGPPWWQIDVLIAGSSEPVRFYCQHADPAVALWHCQNIALALAGDGAEIAGTWCCPWEPDDDEDRPDG